MLGALGRWVSTIFALLTGRVDKAREVLDRDPTVMKTRYDEIVRDKMEGVKQYTDAVATKRGIRNNKATLYEKAVQDTLRLEAAKAGAVGRMRKRLQELGNVEQSAVHKDEVYQRCRAAFTDFSSSLESAQERTTSLEADIERLNSEIGDHDRTLERLAAEIGKLRTEAADTIARIISAEQESELDAALAGISHSDSADQLANLRSIRDKVEGKAQTLRVAAKADVDHRVDEFTEFALQGRAEHDFDALLGIGNDTDAAAVDSTDETAAPASDLPG